MGKYRHYEILSLLFDYPSDNYLLNINKITKLLTSDFPDFFSKFKPFLLAVEKMDQHQLEEYYLNTFLMNPVSSLDIGFVLFGEDYKRNVFLSLIQSEQLKAGNDCGTELADHLPNILRLLPKFDSGIREEFSWCLLLPAITEICLKFSTTDNFYYYAFHLLETILKTDFGHCTHEQFIIRKKEKVEYE